jgi:hypothetical protein
MKAQDDISSRWAITTTGTIPRGNHAIHPSTKARFEISAATIWKEEAHVCGKASSKSTLECAWYWLGLVSRMAVMAWSYNLRRESPHFSFH